MNKEIYFQNVLDIGDLYLDRVLNVFEDENIVFVCVDKNENYYFAICYEFRKKLGWILCRIDNLNALINVLLKVNDMYSIFEDASTELIEIIYENDMEKSEYIVFDDCNKRYLPTQGVYLKPDDDLLPYAYDLLLKANLATVKSSRYVDYEIIDSKDAFNDGYKYVVSTDNKINLKYEYEKEKNTKEFSRTYLGDAA